MANPLSRLMNDSVFIINSKNERNGPYKTAISSKGEATIFDETIDVEEGYKLIRPLPSGKDDVFTILEANYSPGLHAIPAHYSLKIRKDTSLMHNPNSPKSTTINISNSQGIQVGDHNVQNIANSIGELISQINASDSNAEEKLEAKGQIREMLSNPTVAAILGGTASGLFTLLN